MWQKNASCFVCLYVLLLVAIGSCRSTEEEETIKFVTWNVLAPLLLPLIVPEVREGGIDPSLADVDVRTAKQIDSLKAVDADIMCLQEVDAYQYKLFKRAFSSFDSEYTQHSEELWGVQYVGKSAEWLPGNAMFYRKNLFSVQQYESVEVSRGRKGAFASFKSNSVDLLVSCLHLESGFEEIHTELRTEQLETSLQQIRNMDSKLSVKPVKVILGDFNYELDNATSIQHLMSNGYKDVFQSTGRKQPMTFYHREERVGRYDFIFYNSNQKYNVTVRKAEVFDKRNKEFSMEANAERTEMLMPTILKYKANKIRSTNSNPIKFLPLILQDFFNVKPQKSPNPRWQESTRNRMFRIGSDHLFMEAELAIKLI